MSLCSGSLPLAVASSSGRGLTGPTALGHRGEPGRVAGILSMVPELWSRPCGRGCGRTLSDLCPVGDRPRLPGWQALCAGPSFRRGPPPGSMAGAARPFWAGCPMSPPQMGLQAVVRAF